MSYIGQGLPADVFGAYTVDTFTGNGSATTFTLSEAPASDSALIVVIDNVIQQPTTNFTVSGTTLTIVGTAILSGITGYAIHTQGKLPIGTATAVDTNGASDGIILDADGDTTISADTDDQIDFKTGGSDRMHIESGGNIGIGTSSSEAKLHILKNDSGALLDGNADNLFIEDNTTGITIGSANDGEGHIRFSDSDDADVGAIGYFHGSNYMNFRSDASEALRLTGQKLSTSAEDAPDCDAGGLTLDQNANDGIILSFKSSDVNAGGGVSGLESDTYVAYKKLSGSAGGLLTQIQSEGVDCHETRALIAEGTTNTTKSTSANAPIMFKSAENHSGGIRALSNAGTNSNLFIIADHTTRRFIFDSEGDLHSDSSNTTFDSYEDAHLVRAFDLSHGRGVIDSKFDEFVKYKHEDLANIGLVGREEDGTPNHFINITGFQRLHNGAIWQQYEKHQRLAEAVYEMAKEALGEDKADAILEKHDIKLLN